MMFKEYSVSPAIILLLLTIMGISHIFYTDVSQNLKTFLRESTMLKQLIIFLLILTVISYVYKSENIKTIFFISFIIYVLLLFTLKSNYKFQLAIIAVLCIYNIYSNFMTTTIESTLKDPFLSMEQKMKILENYDNKRILAYGGISLFIIGSALYNEHVKQNQFGEKFNLIKFLYPPK